MVGLALLGLVVAAFRLGASSEPRQAAADRQWMRAAQQLGARTSHSADGWQMRGDVEGFAFELRELRGSPAGTTRLHLDFGERLPLRWSAWRSGAARPPHADDGDRVVTGDVVFDDEVELCGNRVEVLAALSAPARQALVDFVRELDGRIEPGRLVVVDPSKVVSEQRLVGRVRAVGALAAKVAFDAQQLPARLALNACHDFLAEVRLANLEQLFASFPEHESAVDAARRGLVDSSAAIRRLSEQSLGERAIQPLLEIAGRDGPAEVRAEALLALCRPSVGKRSRGVIERAFGDSSVTVRRAAVEATGRAGHHRLAPLVAHQAAEVDFGVRLACAAALGELPHACSEPALIGLLGDPAPEVKSTAARSLGRIGSVAAVEPLLPLSRGVLGDAALQRVARLAVTEIQSRLGSVEGGRLSLADADGSPGRLSLPKKPGPTARARSRTT